MSNNTIAVDDQLSNVKKMLLERGYNVVSSKDAGGAKALVVDGMENNLMDIQNITTEASVIDASGKSPYDILSQIREIERH